LKFSLLISFLLLANAVYSQEIEKLDVTIETLYPSYISLDQVLEIAKSKCFEKALDISDSYINVERNTQSTTITQNDSITIDNYFFNFNTNHSARIIDYEILNNNISEVDEKRTFELEMSIFIQAFETKIDPSFTFQINDMITNFTEDDVFEFKLTPNVNGYFSLFVIDGEEVYRIFPNELEKANFFEAKTEYNFPRSRFVEYELEANKNEVSEFYFVYTKKDVSFSNIEIPKDFLKLLYSLELDQRAVEIKPITLLKK